MVLGCCVGRESCRTPDCDAEGERTIPLREDEGERAEDLGALTEHAGHDLDVVGGAGDRVAVDRVAHRPDDEVPGGGERACDLGGGLTCGRREVGVEVQITGHLEPDVVASGGRVPLVERAVAVEERGALAGAHAADLRLFEVGHDVGGHGDQGQDLLAEADQLAFVDRQAEWAGYRPGDRRAWLRGDPIVPARQHGGPLWRFNRADNMLMLSSYHLSRYNGLAYPALRGANQLLNAAGALAALEAMRAALPITAQAVRNGFALVELPGRFQIVAGQPTLVLDVAHNPHSVAALAQNLDQMGFHRRFAKSIVLITHPGF